MASRIIPLAGRIRDWCTCCGSLKIKSIFTPSPLPLTITLHILYMGIFNPLASNSMHVFYKLHNLVNLLISVIRMSLRQHGILACELLCYLQFSGLMKSKARKLCQKQHTGHAVQTSVQETGMPASKWREYSVICCIHPVLPLQRNIKNMPSPKPTSS